MGCPDFTYCSVTEARKKLVADHFSGELNKWGPLQYAFVYLKVLFNTL